MERLYSTQPVETVSLKVESSPVWEVILGIAGFTHKKLRHTFELNEDWLKQESRMPSSLIKNLKWMEENNTWYGLIMLQNKLSAQTISDFSKGLREISRTNFYDVLLPYLNRDTESIRKETALNYGSCEVFAEYANYFRNHEFLESYVQSLGRYEYETLCHYLINTVQEWDAFIQEEPEWNKWCTALTYEQNQQKSIDHTSPAQEIERITGGVNYTPEPSIWHVKLIPHVSYRPWVLEQRTEDTKLFFYPINEAYFLEQGVPSSELVRGHKALGEELRLKLLYQLLQRSMSLQEMSAKFQISKTTLHHHLSLLKSAKFIRVEKGVYSVQMTHLNRFSERLISYLSIDE
ncbi:ArsR family transcriptional regulator [Bacillus sp. RAR_GA_16]|uniref:ArsR family transcriptional regulator n=1 Tax=Bacillus sp. RAR_GA_16 TaxID=2876774 RepID=UPI001CCD90C8|nr:ArsR family transcriptional regulator [Bacillus sp. RAR_GA_16]MCA0171920.1 helix-turn-helix domain-containing protein [Bacillus sp. RAR_GA_16]